MSDIVERLRKPVNWLKQDSGPWKDVVSTYDRSPFYAADDIERLRGELAAAKAVIENIVVSEVEPLQALLREADTEITTWMYHGHGSTESGFGSAPLLNRIRAALGDEPNA